MQQFLENNWLSVLSILIGVVVSYFFYHLQKKDAASAAAERTKHATAELLDVIESYIINKQRLSEQVIENLIHASERDHRVSLRPACTVVSLLQDVALRLQRSRHLDIPQKSEYSEKIESLIREIRAQHVPDRLVDFGAEIAEKLVRLENVIPEPYRTEARKTLDEIAKLSVSRQEVSLRAEQSREKLMIFSTALAGVSAAFGTTLIGSNLFERLDSGGFTASFAKMFPILGILLTLVVALQAFVTAQRIKKRRQPTPDNAGKTDT